MPVSGTRVSETYRHKSLNITIEVDALVKLPGRLVLAVKNLEKKLENREFLHDLNGLAVLHELEYNPIAAGTRVIEKLLCLL